MIVIRARNPHQALVEGMYQLSVHGQLTETRNGPALTMPCPVTTVYERPMERVVFHELRDANPFFHLFESLWMLAGRNDVSWISQFNKGISKYSDNGKQFHGAYGYRWRRHFKFDQIPRIIRSLKEKPDCRRQVLQMWDPEIDLDLPGKDFPCNLGISFRIRNNALDMTVFNRSNDMIWGAYGANAVHFSFLQEYMAGAIGVKVGKYYQVSNDFHAYVEVYEKLKPLLLQAGDGYRLPSCPYAIGQVEPDPIYDEHFDRELNAFFSLGLKAMGYKSHFFKHVAIPLLSAWKDRDNAHEHITRCAASDWRKAATEWILRRQ